MRTIRITNTRLSNVDYVACGLDLLLKKTNKLSFDILDIQDEIHNAFGVDLRYDQIYSALRYLCKLNEVFYTGKSMMYTLTSSGVYRTEMIHHTNENVKRVYDKELNENDDDIEDDVDDIDDEDDVDDVDDVDDEDVETHDNAFNKSIMDSISTSLSACAKSLEQVANILKMMK